MLFNTAENEYNYNSHFINSVIECWGVCSDKNNKPGTIPSILMWYTRVHQS